MNTRFRIRQAWGLPLWGLAATVVILILGAQAHSWQVIPDRGAGEKVPVPPVPGPGAGRGGVVELPVPGVVPGGIAAPLPPAIPGPRLNRLGDNPIFGTTPNPSAKELAEYGRFVEQFVDPRNTLDLVIGRTRLMLLKETPSKVQVADENIATVNSLSPKQLILLGRRVGTTVLTLFFTDPKDRSEKILTYLVRVIPDPEEKARLKHTYKALEKEINETFLDSTVRISLVGDKVAVCGQAKDIAEGTHILQIIRSNVADEHKSIIPVNNLSVEVRPDPFNPNHTLPGLSNFLSAGGPNIVNLLRVPGEQQVMLKVVVAEVNRSAARSIGLNFSITNNQGIQVFNNRTGNIGLGGSQGVTNAGAGGGIGGGLGGLGLLGLVTNNLPVTLDNGKIPLAINALRTLNYARSLAEPNLVALNGQAATFQAGGQFPVPVVSSFSGTGGNGAGLQGVNFIPFGVQLQFTPYITDKDRIRLNLSAEVSTRNLSTGTNVGGSGVPGLNTRNIQTTVELREGQTLAVAGLIQNNIGSQASRIPGLGDIPVLNRILGFDQLQSSEQELVLLVTPELVSPLEPKEVPPLPGSDLFEPGDLEFYVLGRLESRRNYDYRSPVRDSCARMKAYRHMEDIYLFGACGFTEAPPVCPGTP